MLRARETALTFFPMYLSPLMSEVYLLVNHFEKPIQNAVRHFSCIGNELVQSVKVDESTQHKWVNV